MSMLKGVARLFWQPAELGEEAEEPASVAAQQSLQPSSTPSPLSGISSQPERIKSALLSMRDVEGVLGSLAVGPGGTLIAADLPPRLGWDVSQRLAARLRQLHEALALEGGKLGAADLRFAELRLQVAPINGGLVGVLADQKTNSPALSMALNLAAHQIEAEVAVAGF